MNQIKRLKTTPETAPRYNKSHTDIHTNNPANNCPKEIKRFLETPDIKL